jgi:hypothetical protein
MKVKSLVKSKENVPRFGNTEHTLKKRLSIFPSPAGMSLAKLSLAGDNLIIDNENYSQPGRVWLVPSRLGTGKSLTFFSV